MGKLCATFVLATIISLFLLPLSVFSQSTDIKYPETKQVLNIVQDASQAVAQKGEAAFPEFRKKGSKWLHDDVYVFVIDTQGNVILNPTRPELEGKNQINLKDAMGKPFIRWFIKEVTDYSFKTQGWSHYVWFKPGQEIASWKTSFVKYVKAPSGKGYIVGSGLYEMRPEKIFVVDIVDEAAELVRKDGRGSFPVLRDKAGEFNYLTTYVFVIDTSGTDLVNPAFPQHEGKNVLSLKDSSGKFFIRDMVAMLAGRDSGWTVYSWPKPRTIKPSVKETYVKKVKHGNEVFFVGSGIYLE
ncbi:MAG TPA: cache domain-containing protein [Syntrophorhabdaceae bacterium]|nr:cache domain-containing protein [Syntrophorhabdaceae bacterium]